MLIPGVSWSRRQATNTVQNVLYMASRKKDADLATKMWVLAQGWNHEFSDVSVSRCETGRGCVL